MKSNFYRNKAIKKDYKDKVVSTRIPHSLYDKLVEQKVNISASIRKFLESLDGTK